MNKLTNRLSNKLLVTAGIAAGLNLVFSVEAKGVTIELDPGSAGQSFAEITLPVPDLVGLTLGDLEDEFSFFYSDDKFLRHSTNNSSVTLDIVLDSLSVSPNFGNPPISYTDENGASIAQASSTSALLNEFDLTISGQFDPTPQDHYGFDFDLNIPTEDEARQISAATVSINGLGDPFQILGALPEPPDLGPGDEFQVIFVTQDRIWSFSSPDDYNDFAQSQAELNPGLTGTDSGVTYKAFATMQIGTSDDFISAPENAPIVAPLYLLDGTFVASSVDQLCFPPASLASPINLDQFGTEVTSSVQTGSDSGCSLSAQNNFLGAFNGGQVLAGRPTETSSDWISFGELPSGPLFEYPIYAVSSVITVPNDGSSPSPSVPEPSPLVGLLALGTMGAVSKLKKSQK